MRKCMIFLGLILLAIGLSFFSAWIVMLLWNYVMADVFNLPELTFWKTYALCVLIELIVKLILPSKKK